MIKSEDIEFNNVCVKVFNEDCLNVLREMPSNSVDSIVSDPPYGISFMAKKWDYDVPSVEVWKEAMRVLKPGGHALIACGTRTQHRMVVNIEDAGFEIRDVVSWIYGSGFPKSLNISKAIDKAAGAEREVVEWKKSGGGRTTAANPMDRNAGKTNSHDPVTAPATKAAQQWDGWGTALKPACEFFTLCRKPLSEKTVAENVLKWGTGGINIDVCRVGTETITQTRTKMKTWRESEGRTDIPDSADNSQTQTQGRFPANLIPSGEQEVLELFPETGKSGTAVRRNGNASKGLFPVAIKEGSRDVGFNDSGSAARFFYTPKASKKDRNEGCDELEKGNNHATVKPTALMSYLCRLITPTGGVVLDPYMGSGSTGKAAVREGFSFVGIELDPDYYEICKARIII